ADGSDLRFTDTTCSVLNYWIERGVNTSTCEIWVKVPSIAASTISQILLFYGNGSAPAYSNGDNTFILFDDFNGSNLNLTKWNRTSYANSTNTGITGGYVHILQDQTDKSISIYSTNTTLPYQTRVISKKRIHANYQCWNGQCYYYTGSMQFNNGSESFGVLYDKYFYATGGGCTYDNRDSFVPSPCVSGQKINGFWDNTWFREEMTLDGAATTNNYYLSRFDGTTFQDITTYTAPTLSTNNFYLNLNSYGWWTNHFMDVDYIAVAKFIKDEPTVSLGSEAFTCH
ncbi:MAG: DUF2341 domain-containing protein, partial [Bacteroidetes bacterium]|nr:DUF2341 domain-containing protein [Bacteroidota bacterium]